MHALACFLSFFLSTHAIVINNNKTKKEKKRKKHEVKKSGFGIYIYDYYLSC